MKKSSIKPQFLIILSFLCVILIGAILLMLPFATINRSGLGFIDALFVATSATCVTGLSTIHVGTTLSLFGRIVLAVLIEIGGLSFLTLISFVFALIGGKENISQMNLMKEALNQESFKGLYALVKKIVVIAFSIQLVGALSYFLIFLCKYHFSVGTSLEYGLFHAVSAFNNAGFDILTDPSVTSLMAYKDDIGINLTTMILIVLGGIGFIVLTDIFKKKKWRKFELHTKVVLVMTASLIFGGAILFKLFYTLNDEPITWLQAFFQSVTARTAGFLTLDASTLPSNSGAYIVMLILMFVGASPCSTGGGFKTTSLFVLLVTVISFIKGTSIHAFKRKIPNTIISKVLILFVSELLYIFIIVAAIGVIENSVKSGITLDAITLETVSAFGTVGLSTGITSSLHVASKILIIITMYIGRLGPLTLLSFWNNRKEAIIEKNIKFIEGNITVG